MKVGDYVRTKDDGIQKITFFDEFSLDSDEVFFGTDKTEHYADVSTTDIIGEPSPNIIDLIEVGDYVNGYKVKGKTNDEVIVDYYCYSKELCDGHYLHWHKDYIKSIVTKEMFEQMEYKIE